MFQILPCAPWWWWSYSVAWRSPMWESHQNQRPPFWRVDVSWICCEVKTGETTDKHVGDRGTNPSVTSRGRHAEIQDGYMQATRGYLYVCWSKNQLFRKKKSQTSEPSSWWQTKVFAVSGHYHKSLPTPKVIVLLVDCQGNRSPQESSHVRSRAVDKILHQLIHSDIILISQWLRSFNHPKWCSILSINNFSLGNHLRPWFSPRNSKPAKSRSWHLTCIVSLHIHGSSTKRFKVS